MSKSRISKILLHIRSGSLFSVIRSKLHRKYYGHLVPIGDNYNGKKADVYDKHRVDDEYWRLENAVLKGILNDLPQNISVLDVPFGTGRFVPIYSEKNFNISGLDSSRDMLNLAKKKYSELINKTDITFGDAKKLPYAHAQFDLLVSFRFLSWIVSFGDLKVILGEYARVCKTNAVIELCVGPETVKGKTPNNKLALWNQYNKTELIDLLLSYNFRVVKVVPIYDDDEHPGLSAFLCEKI
jgi:ubiquinone/menaquinone biosynthesis C-methylase UbiE